MWTSDPPKNFKFYTERVIKDLSSCASLSKMTFFSPLLSS